MLLFPCVLESLVKDGEPFHSDKSKILSVIIPEQTQNLATANTSVQGYIVDLSVEIRAKASILESPSYLLSRFTGLLGGIGNGKCTVNRDAR